MPMMASSDEMSDGTQQIRLAFTSIHLFLVVLGSLNLLLIVLIACKPYLRSITNVYMLCLCLADFLYLTGLVFVATTSLNNKSWPFGELLCSVYHGAETTAKYASVLFITLLALDRYFAICKSNVAKGYRSYNTAITLSVIAWIIGIVFSFPLYYYAETKAYKLKKSEQVVERTMCYVAWPSPDMSTWYVGVCSLVLFILPGTIVFFCYYQVFCKLREHIKGSRRLHRASSARYRRVTLMVQRVVLFHLICWTPFWMFNLFSTLNRVRVTSVIERIIINIIHLFPYINCAINPILYAHGAENFRTAFREVCFCAFREIVVSSPHSIRESRSTCRSSNVADISGIGNLSTSDLRNGARTAESVSIYVPEDEESHLDTTDVNTDDCKSPIDGDQKLDTVIKFQDDRSRRKLVPPIITMSLATEGTLL